MPQAVTARHIFLTGQPGVGKTTAAVNAVRNVNCAGFYTSERRSASGERQGFDVVDIQSGERGTLASVGRGKAMVGKYAVDVADFERVAFPSLQASERTPISLIDECGKMELFSETFFQRVTAILDDAKSTVIGTLPMPRYGHKVAAVEAIRARPDVAVVKLLKANRDAAARAIDEVVKAASRLPSPGGLLDVSALVAFMQEGQVEKLTSDGRLEAIEASDQLSTCLPAEPPAPPPQLYAAVAAAASSAPPLLGDSPRVLLLGETASPLPGPGELAYADRSMWSVLRVAFDLPDGTSVADTQAAVLMAGVAVWDVLANVHVRGGRKRGRGVEAEVPNLIPELLAAHPTMQSVAFIGNKARAAFERHHGTAVLARGVEIHVLPSSSRANTQPLSAKAAEWRRVLHHGA